MPACEITELGIAHAGLSKLEDVFSREDQNGRNLIIQGILEIHRALRLVHSIDHSQPGWAPRLDHAKNPSNRGLTDPGTRAVRRSLAYASGRSSLES